MGNQVKAIIFDWGRTLHDPESKALFIGVEELLKKLSQKYFLALISLAKSDNPENRRHKIEVSGIAKYFRVILVGDGDKNKMYEQVLEELSLSPEEIAVVDDRILRGVAWGNRVGAKTIWLRKGKFQEELPTLETDAPLFTIKDIREVETLFP